MGEYADYDLEQFIDGFERRAEKASRKRSEPKQFRCPVCGRSLRTAEGRDDHVRDKHGQKAEGN